MTAVEIHHGARTDVGLVREHNEDAYLAAPPVFVVADGMGGHEGGDVASAIVVEEFGRLATDGFDPEQGRACVAAVLATCRERLAQVASQQHADGVPDRHQAGTTVVAALLVEHDGEPTWLVVNVGDSRAYCFADGRLQQVTADHSLVQQLVDSGEISPDEASTHPQRNIVTRALGTGVDSEPDCFLLPVPDVERLLLCTDGVSGLVGDDVLCALLTEVEDPRDAADRIVAAALEAGGEDNATAVVVDVVGLVSDDTYDAVAERRSLEEKLGALP